MSQTKQDAFGAAVHQINQERKLLQDERNALIDHIIVVVIGFHTAVIGQAPTVTAIREGEKEVLTAEEVIRSVYRLVNAGRVYFLPGGRLGVAQDIAVGGQTENIVSATIPLKKKRVLTGALQKCILGAVKCYLPVRLSLPELTENTNLAAPNTRRRRSAIHKAVAGLVADGRLVLKGGGYSLGVVK